MTTLSLGVYFFFAIKPTISINNSTGIKIGNNKGNKAIVRIVQIKTPTPKIKMPIPVKIKNNNVATQIMTMLPTATPKISAVTFIEIFSKGNTKCQATKSASMTPNIINTVFLKALFSPI